MNNIKPLASQRPDPSARALRALRGAGPLSKKIKLLLKMYTTDRVSNSLPGLTQSQLVV